MGWRMINSGRRKKWLCLAVISLAVCLWIAAGGNKALFCAADGESREAAAETKYVALTFDDGPHSVYTEMLLDGLKERNVKATFFLIGDNIKGNEELVRRMDREGHLIGNHTSTHVLLTDEPEAEACREITETNERICSITGKMPTYIRPPFGSWSEKLECMVPMDVVLWNVDPLDWKIQNTKKIVNHILKNTKNSSIILLHDSYKTSVEAALEVVDTLSGEGYTFVTVDEMLID